MRLPIVAVDSDTTEVHVDVSDTVPLKIHSLPVSTTFAIFDEYVVLIAV